MDDPLDWWHYLLDPFHEVLQLCLIAHVALLDRDFNTSVEAFYIFDKCTG